LKQLKLKKLGDFPPRGEKGTQTKAVQVFCAFPAGME
jgi:hypothetical protein